MFEKLILFTLFVAVITLLAQVVGANLYDLREVKKQQRYNRTPQARRYRRRPLISVIVLTHNDEDKVEACLQSLLQSSYRKLEIIVVDAASQDKTKQLVKTRIAQNPKKVIRLFAKHATGNNNEAIAAGYQKYGSGELIMLLNAGGVVDNHALSKAVQHFNSDNRIGVLSPAYHIIPMPSVLGLFQKYENMVRFRAKKLISVTNSDYTGSGEGAIYRRSVFLSLLMSAKGSRLNPVMVGLTMLQLGNKHVQSYYASDVVISTKPQQSLLAFYRYRYQIHAERLQALAAQRHLLFNHNANYTRFLTWFRLPFAICVEAATLVLPVLLGYSLYLAFALRQPQLLVLSWAVLALYLLFAIWGDDRLRFIQKAMYSLGIPVTYGLFYLVSFIQALAVLKGVLLAVNKLFKTSSGKPPTTALNFGKGI